MSIHQKNENVVSRREALKSLAVITGVVSISNLPNRWNHPSIEVGVLPVHAQCSSGTLFKVSDGFASATICQGYLQWVAEISYNVPATGKALHFEVEFSGGDGGDALLILIDGSERGTARGWLNITFCIDFGTHTQAVLDLWATDALGCDTNYLNYILSQSNVVAEPDTEPAMKRISGSVDW